MPDRLQREVEELLANLDKFPVRRSPWARARDSIRRGVRAFGDWLAGIRLPHINVRNLLLLGVAIVIIAYVFNPGSPSVTRTIIVAGIVIFLVAFALSLVRQGRAPEKRWRGEPMELGGRGAGGRLRTLWGRWRRR
ncbi:MAG TPA: hypothetical protein VFT91_02240 [Dehalococcoidia bacterium]|nr:hypothetical protein [Dehalococcoidia bacterium]